MVRTGRPRSCSSRGFGGSSCGGGGSSTGWLEFIDPPAGTQHNGFSSPTDNRHVFGHDMSTDPGSTAPPEKKRYVRAVGPRLRWLLYLIFGLFALLGANSVYLTSITFLEWLKGDSNVTYQNYFYMVMFGTHLGLGLLLVLPVIVFGLVHIRNAHDRPNRRAVRVGYLLFGTSLAVLFTGLALMRFDFFSIKNPNFRSPIYWAHVITPLLAVWLYVIHRLAG